MTLRSTLWLASVLPMLVAGCSSSAAQGDAFVDVGMSSGSSALTTAPASADAASAATGGDAAAPSPGAAHLRVTVAEVDVHVAAADEADVAKTQGSADGANHGASSGGAVDDTSGWSVVFTGSQRVDLLAGDALEALLGGARVPAGRVTQVRLILADDATLVENGVETTLKCGSCTHSGLKIVTDGTVVIGAGDHLHLTLALDPAQSVVIEGDARQLRPVVRLAGAAHEK